MSRDSVVIKWFARKPQEPWKKAMKEKGTVYGFEKKLYLNFLFMYIFNQDLCNSLAWDQLKIKHLKLMIKVIWHKFVHSAVTN